MCKRRGTGRVETVADRALFGVSASISNQSLNSLFLQVGDGSGHRSDAGGGKGGGVMLLDPCGHLLADQAAEVKILAGVA